MEPEGLTLAWFFQEFLSGLSGIEDDSVSQRTEDMGRACTDSVDTFVVLDSILRKPSIVMI